MAVTAATAPDGALLRLPHPWAVFVTFIAPVRGRAAPAAAAAVSAVVAEAEAAAVFAAAAAAVSAAAVAADAAAAVAADGVNASNVVNKIYKSVIIIHIAKGFPRAFGYNIDKIY